MLPRGIQTKISLTLLVLLLTGMILVDLILLNVIKNQFFQIESQRAENILRNLQQELASKSGSEPILKDPDRIKGLIESNFWMEPNNCLAVMTETFFSSTEFCASNPILKRTIRNAMQLGQKQFVVTGRQWAVFQKGVQYLITALPLQKEGQAIGSVGLMLPLTSYYSILRRSQKIFVFYLFINVSVLSVGGYYLISRIFMRPIKRLVSRAEQYDARLQDREEDLQFSVRLEDGELNKLSLALNQMMNRISKDREKMRENVKALEKVNQDLKRAQNDVVRAEKLASVGRLSAGIAHEIGNPIGIILGYLELLKSTEPSGSEWKDYLGRAEAEILRINTIIRQLLNLSRPVQGEPQRLSMHSFLMGLIESIKVQPLLGSTAINLKPDAKKDLIIVDPDHLRQVCLNLLINAADAIKSSNNASNGAIWITTVTKERALEKKEKQQEIIEIDFCDNGVGISATDLENIFDPFFTTKEPGRGTGLGLSVSLTIIEQMGGTLTAASRPDQGAVLTISLPLADSPV